MIGAGIYLLCAITSLMCTVLLYMKYLTRRLPLLFWSSFCFLCFAINNVLLVFDMVIWPQDIDLSLIRLIPAAIGPMVLIWRFIWDMQ